MGEQLRKKKSAAAEVFNQVKQTRDTYIEHIKAVLPEREEAEIFQVLEEDYSNVNQVLAAWKKNSIIIRRKLVMMKKRIMKPVNSNKSCKNSFIMRERQTSVLRNWNKKKNFCRH